MEDRPIGSEECTVDPSEIHGEKPKMEANEGKSVSARIVRIDRRYFGSKEGKGVRRRK